MNDTPPDLAALKGGPFKGPYMYDPYGAGIWSAGNVHAMDIRGHGHLVGTLRMDEETAAKAQDAFGRAVVDALSLATRAAESERLLKEAVAFMENKYIPGQQVGEVGARRASLPARISAHLKGAP